MTTIRLDTIQPKPLQWLWRPRIPLGRLSLLIGHPDRGKSLVACTMAASVTQGQPWPDGVPCPQGNVLLLEAEDSLEETIVPRLQAAGANLAMIHTWRVRDLQPLRKLLEEVHPLLVIISPLNTYLPVINTWEDQAVRRALQPLADAADASGAAVLGVMHPTKRHQLVAAHIAAGSTAFGAVARSILTVDCNEDGLYLLEGTKQNLAKAMPPMGYRICSWEQNPDVAQLHWEVTLPTVSFQPLLDNGHTTLATAIEFVEMALSAGPIASNELKIAADRNGIAWRTIEVARSRLHVKAQKEGFGKDAHWMLSLPVRP